jgi:hypothetical protein
LSDGHFGSEMRLCGAINRHPILSCRRFLINM